MATDERHLLIMVERLPEEITRVYSRTKRKKSLQHRNSFKHRKLKKDRPRDEGCSSASPAAREGVKYVSASPSHLPMSLPMYSRSSLSGAGSSATSQAAPEKEQQTSSLKVKVKLKKKKREKYAEGADHVLHKIKIRKIAKEASLKDARKNAAKSDEKGLSLGDDVQEGNSKGASENYEIVSSPERLGDMSLPEEGPNVAEHDSQGKAGVDDWAADHTGESNEETKGDDGSVSQESAFDKTYSSTSSSPDQDTESYHSEADTDVLESDSSQSTEIDAGNCTSSDTEIDEPQRYRIKITKSGEVEAVPVVTAETSSGNEVVQDCNTTLEQIVSEVCSGEESPAGNDGNCAGDSSEGTTAKGQDDLPSPPLGSAETTPAQPEDSARLCEVLDCEDLHEETSLPYKAYTDKSNDGTPPMDVIDITEDAVVLDFVTSERTRPCTPSAMPPADSSTGETTHDARTKCATDIVDLTSDDADCYVVSPAGQDDVVVVSSMTGVCMEAAQELDLFANMTILESWNVEAESILACAEEYLGHLEKCLTSLDLMEEASRAMLVTALRDKGLVFKQIFGQLKTLLRRTDWLDRVFSIESGFCALLGLDKPLQARRNCRRLTAEAKEPNDATKALIRCLSQATEDDVSTVLADGLAVAQDVPSVQHRLTRETSSSNDRAPVDTHSVATKPHPACNISPSRARMSWRHLMAVANRRERPFFGYQNAAAPGALPLRERRASLGTSEVQAGRPAAVAATRHSSASPQQERPPLQPLVCQVPFQQIKPRSAVVLATRPLLPRLVPSSQTVQSQSNDPNVSKLLKELKQMTDGNFTPANVAPPADSRGKIVTLEAKQAQPPKTATVTSASIPTGVTASPLLPASSASSVSLSRHISLVPVATTSSNAKVTTLPASVTVLPVSVLPTSSASVPSSTVTTTLAGGSASGKPPASSSSSAPRSSPQSILQKLQQNTGLTVMPVQQREKSTKEDVAATIAVQRKSAPAADVSGPSSEASAPKESVIAVPPGLSITNAVTRTPAADKSVVKTSEQVAVIQLAKVGQRQSLVATTKPGPSVVSSVSVVRSNNPTVGRSSNPTTSHQLPSSALRAQAASQGTGGMSSRVPPAQQPRPVGYGGHPADGRPVPVSAYPSAIISRSVVSMNLSPRTSAPRLRPVTLMTSATANMLPRTVTAQLRPVTVAASSHRPLLPRPPQAMLVPVSSASVQSAVQAPPNVAPVLVQAQPSVRWAPQPQQPQQPQPQQGGGGPPPLCVPGFLMVRHPPHGRPTQWGGGAGLPNGSLAPAGSVLHSSAAPPFPWGGFAPQDGRLVAGMGPLGGPQQPLAGQVVPAQQPYLPRAPPYYR